MVTYKAKKFLEQNISSDSGEQGSSTAYTLTHVNVPDWWQVALCKITSLMELPENWDSYGALPIDRSLAYVGVNLLQEISSNEVPEPSIVPTTRGTIQFEWHTAGIDFELDVISSTKINTYFMDEATGMEWEKVLDFDLSQITAAIDLLVSKKYAQEQAA